MIKRRVAIPLSVAAIGLFFGCAEQSGTDGEAQVRDTLTAFLIAFENGNLEQMEAAFADDAVTFPRAIMSEELAGPIDSENYLRVSGLDPEMRRLIAGWQSTGADGPPYMELDPLDVEINMFADAALATFHLRDGSTVSRRTFVLARRDDAWKIVHLHASNIVGSD